MAQELRGRSKVESICLGEGEGTAVLVGSCPHPRVYISVGSVYCSGRRSAVRNCAKGGKIGRVDTVRRHRHNRRDKQSVGRTFRRSYGNAESILLIDRESEAEVTRQSGETPSPNATEVTRVCS
jgi:hypothetical protein